MFISSVDIVRGNLRAAKEIAELEEKMRENERRLISNHDKIMEGRTDLEEYLTPDD